MVFSLIFSVGAVFQLIKPKSRGDFKSSIDLIGLLRNTFTGSAGRDSQLTTLESVERTLYGFRLKPPALPLVVLKSGDTSATGAKEIDFFPAPETVMVLKMDLRTLLVTHLAIFSGIL